MKIASVQSHPKGKLYTISLQNKAIRLILTTHCLERMRKWKIPEQKLFQALLEPEEVLIGHRERYIAHRRSGNHLVRTIYEYEDDIPVIITVYFPYSEQYFQGGGQYEDKIFR